MVKKKYEEEVEENNMLERELRVYDFTGQFKWILGECRQIISYDRMKK